MKYNEMIMMLRFFELKLMHKTGLARMGIVAARFSLPRSTIRCSEVQKSPCLSSHNTGLAA